MLPTLPLPLARRSAPACRRSGAALGLLAGVWLLLLAGPAGALEVTLDAPAARAGYVWLNLALEGVISNRVEDSLIRGMPATLQFHTELWRKRTGWFDRLEHGFDASLKVRYEVWNGRFYIERRGQPPIVLSTLDSVRTALSRPVAIPVGRLESLEPDATYYVLVSVTLKPLSVEDLEEGEGWLSGEVENKRRAGFGIITAIPRSLFDAVRNFSGFGDERARAFTPEFALRHLSAGP